jgi:hypothetical protein
MRADAPNPVPRTTRRRLLRVGAGSTFAAVAAAWLGSEDASAAAGGLPDGARRILGAPVRVQGTAKLRMFGLHIYDARLWVGERFEAERPMASTFALELVYGRTLKGQKIAEASLDEMKRGGPLAGDAGQRWLGFMREAFPDVKNGDQIVGVWDPREERTSFFINGAAAPSLRDAAFGERFFGIWLAPHTSQPEMRLRLLGQAR